MASTIVCSSVAAMGACKNVQPTKKSMFNKVAPAFPRISNGTRTKAMLVWTPNNNKFFETMSFLPPLTDDQISKQVDYIVQNGWIPCLEFADADNAYVTDKYNSRFGATSSGYYDNRYWTMWKLPMFGCNDASQVLKEINACTKAFPDSYIRMVGFCSRRQMQITGLLVHRPPGASEFQAPNKRSIG